MNIKIHSSLVELLSDEAQESFCILQIRINRKLHFEFSLQFRIQYFCNRALNTDRYRRHLDKMLTM